jgi:hypothetical protein
MVGNEFYSKLYEILATYRYNTERIELMEDVLKYFLISKDYNLDVPAKAREIFNQKYSSLKSSLREEKNLKSEWFKQKCILLYNIPQRYIPEYILKKFHPFSRVFEDKFGLSFDSLLLFSFNLLKYLQFKKDMIRFKDEVYRFKSKTEYVDLGFVATPSSTYIEQWKNVITVNISELKRILSGILSANEVKRTLEFFSIKLEDISNEGRINLPLEPILKVDEDTLIILNPEYLTRALPMKYEKIFKGIKEYNDAKGISFEALAQNTLKMLPFKSLSFNVEYGANYEVDAILEFDRSIWFVEMTSHPPSDKALEGDFMAIKRDLKKSIMKCIEQGKRCFSHHDKPPLSYFFEKEKINGIMVIVDGVYPQLNLNTYISFFKEDVPIYVINWFDLRTLIDQPEVNCFEDFLLWRIQRPMPIISFDEKDYWAFYFDYFVQNEEAREAFNKMREKQINTFYISYRFNSKEHLENIAQD